MRSEQPIVSGPLQPVVRRVPIDFRDIARQSGCTRGRLCKTAFGWGVQNGNGGVDFAIVAPPPMLPGETDLRIDDNHWCFCAPNSALGSTRALAALGEGKP